LEVNAEEEEEDFAPFFSLTELPVDVV